MKSEQDIIEKIEGSEKSGFFRTLMWLLFRMPGAIILWIQYYFPSSGKVLVSARQRGNPIMEILFSLGFWGIIGIIVLSKIPAS